MNRFSSGAAFALVFFGLAACSAPPSPAPSEVASLEAPHETLSGIVERYWDERVPPGDSLSPQFLADSLAVDRRFLAEVLAVPRDRLDADARLNYDIFRRRLESDIEGLTYPAELLPVNPFEGMPQQLARTAGDLAEHPLQTAKDYENWQHQIDDYVGWTRQAIANMREGMRRGYTSPRVLMQRMLPLLQSLGEDGSANVFYAPLRSMPQSIKEPERTRLSASLTSAVKVELLPAYRELHDFIEREYLPRARVGVALSALPLGRAWYAASVKRATGSGLTPNEIHGIGMAEIERIRARLTPLTAGAPPAGAVDFLNAYQELKAQTLAAMPALFSAVPGSDFEIRSFGLVNEAAPPLAYQPAAPERGTPAILYVNTASSAPRPGNLQAAAFLQEALPGRHYQSALQQESHDLPRFRRFGGDPAFVDGWALYAASLGEELGLYRDDEAKRGALLAQLRCAAALVVDTGLHEKEWTRSQAVEFLRTQLAADDAAASLMADRFVAFPGKALACKMGELRIQALRSRAQQVLGARFDIREFHTEILKDGAMPLDILEAKMRRWMETR